MPENRLKALKKVPIESSFEKFHFIIVLIDFNPRSKLFYSEGIKELPFRNQIKLMKSNIGFWEANLENI